MTGPAELTFTGKVTPSRAGGAIRNPLLTPWGFGLVVGLMVFASYPAVVLGQQTFVFRDFGLFSFPNAFFQRECFWRGELPMWNPFNNCGIPFLAQWNTMALYPPALIYLLFPLQWSLSFFCLLHVIWGGVGMYVLARRWTGHTLAAAVAGVIFSFNGLVSNFLMWPSHVATFSWLPWVLWLVPEAWRNGGRLLAWAVLAGAMQVLAGGPETVFFTWLLLALLAAGEWLKERQRHAALPGAPKPPPWWNRTDTTFVARFTATGCLIFVVCAAQLLPFLALLNDSQRDTSYSSNSHDWAMPFWGWANFLVPLFRTSPTAQGVYFQNGQYWTSSYYAGIGTVLLVLVALWRAREWRVRVLALALFAALVLAWGDSSALFSALHAFLPGLGFIRYPVKFVILALAVAPLLAAFGMKSLAEKGLGRFEWGCAIGILSTIGAIIAVETRTPESAWSTTLNNGLIRCVILLLTVALMPLALNRFSRHRQLFAGLLLGVFWLDLFTHVPNQNPTVAPAVYTSACAGIVQNKLNPGSGGARVFVNPRTREYLAYNPLPNTAENFSRNRSVARANANLLDAIPQVDGFFSLVPRESFELNKFLYSQAGEQAAGLLDLMSVSQATGPGSACGWLARPNALPIITAGQQPVFVDAQTTFQTLTNVNADFRTTIYLPREARDKVLATAQPGAQILSPKFENQRITFQTEASGRCLVALAQTYHPGWKAYIDFKPAKLWRANYAFQGIEVPAGNHNLELVYEDRAFQLGCLLSAFGLLSVVYLGCRAPRPKGLFQPLS